MCVRTLSDVCHDSCVRHDAFICVPLLISVDVQHTGSEERDAGERRRAGHGYES